MTGDHIVALIAIAAMLMLVVPGVARRGLPAKRLVRLAMLWAAIFLAVTAIVVILGR